MIRRPPRSTRTDTLCPYTTLFRSKKTAGGVQRLMAGHHGSDHEVAAMIGFVQNRNAMDWLRTLNHWVAALGRWSIGTWTPSDALMLEKYDADGRCLFSRSSHARVSNTPMGLWHLLVEM